MSLESLSSYIRQPNKENSFHRIYRAHLLQEKVRELLGDGASVTIRGANIRIWCSSEQLAVLARLKKTRLLAQCHKTLGQPELRLSIRVKATR